MKRLVRFSPSSDLRTLQREIDQVFDSFFPSRGSNNDAAESGWTPRVDLAETDNAYLIQLDVPGVTKEDFNINFQDGTLTVSGERRMEETKEDENYVRVERSRGRFYRSFSLPKVVDAEQIKADYKNGVLKITIPKAEETKPRRIDVK